MKKIIACAFLILSTLYTFTQGLEDIIVEKYYVANTADAAAFPGLPAGAVTYRIYVDMAPGYELNSVAGNENHELFFETTTTFYNSSFGATKGEAIAPNPLFYSFPNYLSIFLDSWITSNAAAWNKLGVLKKNDPDGSILTDLFNTDSLDTQDGFMDGTVIPITTIGLGSALDVFGTTGGSRFSTSNGAWNVLGGIQGPTADNRVLIAQLTTDGELSFEMMVTLNAPGVGGALEIYVPDLPATSQEQHFPALAYPVPYIIGCMSPTACNYDPDATIDDAESCVEPVANCITCNGNGTWSLVDTDGDGICNAEEIAGCMVPGACNYDANATDSSYCVFPVEDCLECSGDTVVLVDDDGDGICNALDITGCMSPTACNYNPYATIDSGCVEPSDGCIVCLGGGQWELIDSDNDGICDAEETSGCTNPNACNYNEFATEDDGSCQIPLAGCSKCYNNELVIIDINNNLIPDCEEIKGCMDPSACNYDPDATLSDYLSCLIPDECHVCSQDSTELVFLDQNGDSICDIEITGCRDPNACNYNPGATYDDGSCLIPVEGCTECSEDSASLVLMDADNDGICDREDYSLENIIVEIYYISDSADATITDDGFLPPGSVTYRVYVDLLPGFRLENIYGDENHELIFETTTTFFNQLDRGQRIGSEIRGDKLDEGILALDSWITIGGCSDEHLGILKETDPDGSVIGGINNSDGLLINDAPDAGIPLTVEDGMVPGTPGEITTLGIDLSAFGQKDTTGRFSTNNGAWTVLGGVTGPTDDNIILIGQFTTDGEFSFQFNISTGFVGGGNLQTYVPGNPVNDEIQMDELAYHAVPGCKSTTACNYNIGATIDNGSCLEEVTNCYECSGDTLAIIDSDGDGICNAEDDVSVDNLNSSGPYFIVFPNPAEEILNLEIYTEITGKEFHYAIMDITGKVIIMNNLVTESGSANARIDITPFEKGMYLIKVWSDEAFHSIKTISIQ
jgi:hypothetical protein